MVFEMSQHTSMSFLGSLLPSHVSLKQPFAFEDMDQLETWFDAFAARTAPVDITLDGIYYSEWAPYGIIGFEVVETPTLRALHNQINQELPAIVADPSAPHDGESYLFHLTIETGPIDAANPYKPYYEGLADKKFSHAFRAEHLALFYYAPGPIQVGSFILYRVMPLGGSG